MLRVALLILVPCTSALSGCSRTPDSSGGNVAIVDMEHVAKQLGVDSQMSAQISKHTKQVNQQLVGYQQQLNEQLKSKHAELTANASLPLSEDHKTQLVSFQQELNNQLQQAKVHATQHVAKEKNRMVAQFRQQAERIAAKIAAEKGYDVVLTKNTAVVLTFAPAADITAEVAAEMQTPHALPYSTQSPPSDTPHSSNLLGDVAR